MIHIIEPHELLKELGNMPIKGQRTIIDQKRKNEIWKEIDENLKNIDEVKKIILDINTNDNTKCDLLDNLLFGGL